jgi:hypothetical protein
MRLNNLRLYDLAVLRYLQNTRCCNHLTQSVIVFLKISYTLIEMRLAANVEKENVELMNLFLVEGEGGHVWVRISLFSATPRPSTHSHSPTLTVNKE